MPGEGNEFKTFIANISGGTGRAGGEGGVTGGAAGAGEGPTVNFGGVQNLTSNMYVDSKKFCTSGWSLPLIQGTDSASSKASITKPLGAGSYVTADSSDGRPRPVLYRSKESLVLERVTHMGSSTVIEEIIITCPEQVVAYFYFDFRNDRQQHMDIMLRSIIWQLSEYSLSPYSTLHELYKRLGKGNIQPQHVHLREILKTLLSELDQTYIVIDGLDECNKTDWKHLIKFIHSLCHPAKCALHLLFTSQPLEQFQTAFEDVTFIELGSWVSNNDIRSFVRSEVPRVGNWASDDNYACHDANCAEEQWHVGPPITLRFPLS
ncbi:hypothetical protein K438DRAFT_1777121 [Mycena galopus ATCC 62051]|nr:hypothetical protein K438DRAFT_1777121 [Mycena galopus ATCC 62051]